MCVTHRPLMSFRVNETSRIAREQRALYFPQSLFAVEFIQRNMATLRFTCIANRQQQELDHITHHTNITLAHIDM